MQTSQKIIAACLVLFLVHCGGGKAMRPAKTEDAELNRCLRLSAKKHYVEAVDCLESFKSRYPGSDKAVQAELRIGDSYFRKKDYLLAAESYQQFIRLHPEHPRVDYAYYRMGLAYIKETPKAVDRDQDHLPEALEAFGEVWQNYPDSPYAKIAFSNYQKTRSQNAAQHFYVASFYYRTHEYRATLPRLGEIIDTYADLPVAASAAFLKFKSHLALGESSQAEAALAFMQAKFSDSPLTEKAARRWSQYVSAENRAKEKVRG